MLETDLLKVPLGNGIAVVFLCLGLFIGPYWFIFQFCPELFRATDWIKLLLLCPGIGVPNILLHYYLIGQLSTEEERQKQMLTQYGFAGLASLCPLYLPCLVCFFFHLTFRQAV